jgi:hypothetical protein
MNNAKLEAIVKDIIRAWDNGDMTSVEEAVTAAETVILGKSRVVASE